MDVQLNCMIKKGFSWRGKNEFFPYRVFDAVLDPISQGTEVTIVTEYISLCFFSMLCYLSIMRQIYSFYMCVRKHFVVMSTKWVTEYA